MSKDGKKIRVDTLRDVYDVGNMTKTMEGVRQRGKTGNKRRGLGEANVWKEMTQNYECDNINEKKKNKIRNILGIIMLVMSIKSWRIAKELNSRKP